MEKNNSKDLMKRMGLIKEEFRPNFISEIKGITSNDKPLQLLTEMTIDRLLGKHSNSGYIIISSNRNDSTAQENSEKYKELLQLLKDSGFSYIPVYGGFIENKGKENEKQVYEKSFIVLNFDRTGQELNYEDLYAKGLEWANKFNQDSFLSKAPNATAKYITKSGDVDFEFTGEVKINDLTQQYFTDFFKSKNIGKKTNKKGDEYSKKHRLTFEGVFINPAPVTYNERHVRHLLNEVFITD